MKLRDLFTRRNIIIASVAGTAALVVAACLVLRRPPPVAMEKYIPATALAYLEVPNLADLLDNLTETKAWDELAPILGLSSQLRQVGQVADYMSRTGLGPDEAVVMGRAQYAAVLTGLEAQTGAGEEGPYIHFKPRLALIVETHSKPEVAARMVRDRASILASRVYGDSTLRKSEDHAGTELAIFQGPQPERQLVAAASGSVIVIANNTEAVRSCLDAINGRVDTLNQSRALREMRPAVDQNASVFAFVTEAGIERLVQFGPALFASRFTTDPDRLASVASLFGHLTKQTTTGMLYGSEFASGGVVDRYVTLLRPEVAGVLAEPLKAANSPGLDSLRLVPRDVEDLTILNVDRAGELPGRILAKLKTQLDVVAAMALRQFVISFYEELGIESSDLLGEAVGDEITLVKFRDVEPTAMLVRVKDKSRLAGVITRYLSSDGSTISTERLEDVEIASSSHQDARAAAFIGDYLALGTREQIAKMIGARSADKGIAGEERFKQVMSRRPPGSSIISYRPEVIEAGEMMLALSKLTRVTDGSRELLETERMKRALGELPPAVSFTEFRDYGVYTETRSAVGNFSLIGAFVDQ